MRQVLGGFGLLAGATYPFRVLAVFRRTPHLWRYVAIPILVNLVVGILLYAGLLFFGWETVESLILRLSNWLDSLIINLPTWLSLLKFTIVGLGFLLHFLLVVVLLLLTGFVFVQFGVLIGAPWYGQLSEQLEKLRFGELQIIEVNIVQEISRVLLFEVKKTGASGGCGYWVTFSELDARNWDNNRFSWWYFTCSIDCLPRLFRRPFGTPPFKLSGKVKPCV